MKTDVTDRVRAWEKCQHAKGFQHTKAPLGTFTEPDSRFSYIHLDFIGALSVSDKKQYCLTIIDRFLFPCIFNIVIRNNVIPDIVRHPLTPYSVPHMVKNRSDKKFCQIDIQNSSPAKNLLQNEKTLSQNMKNTRYGRQVHFHKRL
ncbi:integrase catalytic domain-containing protein [Nephila pilipes]|uniref:Integrase catalytic domain-containing protein n=1 Tax=Nephila pilipes TaxID=299642 RepID=A0A8X6UCF3_NEPPI|nr:integrase catalytic domain-containing protein [Nephila pilipes]